MRQNDSSTSLRPEPERLEQMQRLLFGRLALVFLLLLGSWWWMGSYLKPPTETFPTGLFLFFLVSITLTGIYHVVAWFNRDYAWQRRVQFFIDIFLITWLVRETGDINSPYVSLYIVLICLAGFLLGKAETLTITFVSAASFIMLAVLTGQAIIYSISGDIPPSHSFQVVGFNTVAILFVGLLAARISERKRISDELRRSQESFADLNILHERIVQSVDTGLITTDLEGKIYGFNRAAEAISGYGEADSIGKNVVDLCGEDIRARIEACLSVIHSSEFSAEHFEAELPTADRETVTVVCSISPLYRRSGDISGLIIIVQDISQIRALEASLRRADRLAAVGRMAAGLAHEIRNPLGSLSSSLQFLRDRVPTDSSEASLFEVILRESERLNGIIENFLSYARPSSDALDKKEETDIDAALRDCLVLVKHNPKVHEAHQFNYEPPPQPVRSRISETKVKQVMWNLLQNSINAMPDGGDITVKLNEIPGGRIQMLFQDTGPGFTQDNLEHLYEPFSVAANGTGLGLSIVHKIVNDHGGRIDVATGAGKGTKIVVELPQ
ncbi:MAG TPA: ATP-binding protein [Pyrinomonadaceae bacterium]|nr:ATP-binding protein [Pyrinomonadaceae bacterium]